MARWILGVTGGIGSGKSAATREFEALGITVVDADVVAREVVTPGQPALAAIAAHFGNDVIQADGTLNRAALRQIVFSDPAQRKALEAITHPAIRDELARQLAAAASPYVILVSPLLWESGQDRFTHHTLLIDASEASQRERASRRDGVTPEQIDAIMQAQWSRAQRQAKADDIVLNEGSEADLQAAVRRLHATYLARASSA